MALLEDRRVDLLFPGLRQAKNQISQGSSDKTAVRSRRQIASRTYRARYMRAHVQSKLPDRARTASNKKAHAEQTCTRGERTRTANCTREQAQQVTRKNPRSKLCERTGTSKLSRDISLAYARHPAREMFSRIESPSSRRRGENSFCENETLCRHGRGAKTGLLPLFAFCGLQATLLRDRRGRGAKAADTCDFWRGCSAKSGLWRLVAERAWPFARIGVVDVRVFAA